MDTSVAAGAKEVDLGMQILKARQAQHGLQVLVERRAGFRSMQWQKPIVSRGKSAISLDALGTMAGASGKYRP
jgi:hypothetical protein